MIGPLQAKGFGGAQNIDAVVTLVSLTPMLVGGSDGAAEENVNLDIRLQ